MKTKVLFPRITGETLSEFLIAMPDSKAYLDAITEEQPDLLAFLAGMAGSAPAFSEAAFWISFGFHILRKQMEKEVI
jgi:hypothetical protein